MDALLLQLELPTLAFVSGLAGFLMAAGTLGIRLAGNPHPALLNWAVAGLCFGIGYQLGVSVRLPWPGWLGAAIANALIGAGHVMLLVGVQRYLERPPRTRPLLLAIGLLLAASLLFDALREGLRLRVALNLGLFAVLDFAAAWMLWQARAVGLTTCRRVTAVVFGVHGLAILIRLGYVLATDELTTAFVRQPGFVALLLVSTMFLFLLAMALVVMLFRGKAVQLQWLVQHDPMTGLFNRRTLSEHGRLALARSARSGRPLSVLMLDIDAFKAINDHDGHAHGDEVLRQVTACIRSLLRAGDAAFRLGGEEFLVVMPGAAAASALQVAERLRATIAAAPVTALGRHVTASIGVTEARPGETWDAVLQRADAALYRAKREGRDRVVLVPAGDGADAMPA